MDSAIVAGGARDQSDTEAADTEYYLVKTPEPEVKSPALARKTPESRSAQSPTTYDIEGKSRAAYSLTEKTSNIDTLKDGEGGSSSAHSFSAADGTSKENMSPAAARNGASTQSRRETQDFDIPKVDTEQAKARYLKNVRAAWGDGFQVGIPWPDPPGKTFLEDILRLIKNEKVTLHEFRPGITAIYQERTKGATNHLTGWGRFISRGDLKIFLQRRQNGQLVSAEMERMGDASSNVINPEIPMGAPRQALVNQESAYPPRYTAPRQEDIRPLDTSHTQNGHSSAQYSSPYHEMQEAEQHHQQQQRQQTQTVQRIHHSLKEISYTPAAAYYHKPKDKSPRLAGLPGPGPNHSSAGQTRHHSDSPRQNPGQIPVNTSSVRSADEHNIQTPHGSPAFLGRALPAQLSASSSPQVRNGETPLGSPQSSGPMPSGAVALPKCYTCENRMSRQWYPYPVSVQDAASKSFQSMEYQCESCYLRRHGPNPDSMPPQAGQSTWSHSSNTSQNTPPSHTDSSANSSNGPYGGSSGQPAANRSHFISERPDIPLHQRPRKEKWSAWQPKATSSPQHQSAQDAGRMGNGQNADRESKMNELQLQHGHPPPPATPEGAATKLPAFEAYQAYQELQRKTDSRPNLASSIATNSTTASNSTSTNATASADMAGQEASASARKRSFAEIIDLTDDTLVESIERDEQPAQKMSRLGPAPADTYGRLQPPPPQNNVNTHHASSFTQQPQQPQQQHHNHFIPKTTAPPLPPPPPPPSPPPAENLVESIEATIEKNPAVWELKEYDPRTIASDILRAIGQHPDRPGLNEHLKTLQGRFGVDEKSDLGTFLWDSARRGVASQSHVAMPPPLDPPRSHTFIPPPSYHYQKPSNNARPSPGHTTPSSFTPHAPSSLRNASTPVYPHGAARPSLPMHINSSALQSSSSSPHSQTIVPIEPRPALDTARSSDRPITKAYPPGYSPPNTLRTPVPVPLPVSRAPTSALDTTLTPKKRGRPFSKSLPSNSVLTSPGPASSSSSPNGPKKRGRPFSKNLPPAFNPPSASEDSSGPKKRGRPSKKTREEQDLPLPEGKYVAFLCEWEDCPAELQNLETLRAHVFANHVVLGANRMFSCAWAKCSTINDGNPLDFDGSLGLERHIEHHHLRSFARYMGDGPRGTSLDARSVSSRRSFLEDENGRQVTPSVADQEIEKGKAKENNEKRERQKQMGGPLVVLDKIKPIEGLLTFDEGESSA